MGQGRGAAARALLAQMLAWIAVRVWPSERVGKKDLKNNLESFFRSSLTEFMVPSLQNNEDELDDLSGLHR